MKSLYAVAINGTMLYVKGDLSDQDCLAIETIAKKFEYTNETTIDCKILCQAFIEKVKTTLNISLVEVPLQYVFRIKNQRVCHTKT